MYLDLSEPQMEIHADSVDDLPSPSSLEDRHWNTEPDHADQDIPTYPSSCDRINTNFDPDLPDEHAFWEVAGGIRPWSSDLVRAESAPVDGPSAELQADNADDRPRNDRADMIDTIILHGHYDTASPTAQSSHPASVVSKGDDDIATDERGSAEIRVMAAGSPSRDDDRPNSLYYVQDRDDVISRYRPDGVYLTSSEPSLPRPNSTVDERSLRRSQSDVLP